jgi:hypothetical protein
MKASQVAVTLVLGLGISGCGSIPTTAGYEQQLQAWIGDNADHLVSSWGIPQATVPLSDGGRVLEYRWEQTPHQMPGYGGWQPSPTTGNVGVYGSQGGYAGGTYSGSKVLTSVTGCTTRFRTDRDGTIVRWAFQGNGCTASPQKK